MLHHTRCHDDQVLVVDERVGADHIATFEVVRESPEVLVSEQRAQFVLLLGRLIVNALVQVRTVCRLFSTFLFSIDSGVGTFVFEPPQKLLGSRAVVLPLHRFWDPLVLVVVQIAQALVLQPFQALLQLFHVLAPPSHVPVVGLHLRFGRAPGSSFELGELLLPVLVGVHAPLRLAPTRSLVEEERSG